MYPPTSIYEKEKIERTAATSHDEGAAGARVLSRNAISPARALMHARVSLSLWRARAYRGPREILPCKMGCSTARKGGERSTRGEASRLYLSVLVQVFAGPSQSSDVVSARGQGPARAHEPLSARRFDTIIYVHAHTHTHVFIICRLPSFAGAPRFLLFLD